MRRDGGAAAARRHWPQGENRRSAVIHVAERAEAYASIVVMERWVPSIKAGVVFVLGLHLHHRFHGPAVDYLGLAAAAFAGWSVIPGPGEPVLIAESIFAAQHSLDITSVIAVAWVSAMGGGVAGWLLGLKAGRRLVTAPGPFQNARLGALDRGEVIFKRHVVIAIYLSPSWVSGILQIRKSIYLTVNGLTSMAWAAGIGLGAYFAGPPIVDVVGDLGLVSEIGLVLLVILGVAGEFARRRRGASRAGSPPS
jgi:membrane protein DedA with SNARE-associated domain